MALDEKQNSSTIRFSDENHNRCLVKRIGQMRFHSVLTDIILKVEDREFPAHRNVLAASSDYFMAMFGGHMATVDNSVIVHEITAEAMEVLLDFIYKGEITITEDNVEDVFCGSCLLLLDTVTQACCRFFQDRLTLGNCWGIRSFADRFNCSDMLNKVTAFIEEQFVEAIKTKEFLLLPSQEISHLLSDDEIVVPNEEVVFQTLVKWVNHDVENRHCEFPKLLRKVRLPQLKVEYFEENVVNCELVLEHPETHEIIKKARKELYSLQDYEPAKAVAYSQTDAAAEAEDWGTPRRCLRFVEVIVTVGGGALCEFLDDENDVWIPIKPPVTHHCPGLETLNNQIYIVGGSKEWKRSNRVECYNPEINEWVVVSSMRVPRSNVGLVSLNGLLYAVGGYNGRSPIRDVECYSPQKDEWRFVTAMNNCRDGACVVSDGKFIYAISGYDGNNYLSSVEVYDPSSDKWNVGEVSPIIERREDAMAAAIDSKIYVIGGYHGNTFLASCEELDLEVNQWDFKASISSARYQAGVSVLGKAIYICGGWTGNGLASSLVERYDISTNTWSLMASLPAPSAARTAACRFPRKQIEKLSRQKNRKFGNEQEKEKKKVVVV